jgi:hypothetical protein
MPETSMNQKNRAVTRKNNVRFSRKIGPMKPKSIPQPMKNATDRKFGCSVPRTDPRHVGAPLWIYTGRYAHDMLPRREYRPRCHLRPTCFPRIPPFFHSPAIKNHLASSMI